MTDSTNTTYDSPLSAEQLAIFRVYMERAWRAWRGERFPIEEQRGEDDV